MQLKEHAVYADVLVIGGGMAGCFAAIKAKEKAKKYGQNLNVVIVDKGYIGRTGQTIFAATLGVFNPDWGHKIDDWMNQFSVIGEYINNREWNKITLEESYARYLDLISFGVKFFEKNGQPIRAPHPHGAASEVILWGMDHEKRGLDRGTALRRAVEARGIKIMDRVMITDLIKRDKTVIGALGFSVDSPDLYIVKAKATVICTGASGLKAPGWPNHFLSGDGDAMAYRVGADITGKEFYDTHFTIAEYPYYGSWPRPETGKEHYEHIMTLIKNRSATGSAFVIRNAEGKIVPIRGKGWLMTYELEWEAHYGRAPLFADFEFMPTSYGWPTMKAEVIGGASSGMTAHAIAGAVPSNTKCAIKHLQGLYAGGDSLGTMHCGAHYSGFGFALIFAAVSGARAGEGAAEYALRAEEPVIDEKSLSMLKDATLAPLERKGGFSPRWVTSVLQHLLIPYFILRIKHEKRMKAALSLVEFIRDDLIPKLKANDLHELRLAHETKNMVLNAEMMLKASLFRTESRGCHYREDHPRREDPTWLAWVRIRKEGEKMKVWKEPIPKDWWPDLSRPYEERYPLRFPGE